MRRAALHAVTVAVGAAADPCASTYRELRETASALPGWAERRSQALERLRHPPDDGRPAIRYLSVDRSEVVRAQQDEGRQHPDESIAVYRRLLDRVLEPADVRAYREAVALLAEIRATLTAHGRETEFGAEK